MVVAGTDPVAIDSFGAQLFGHQPSKIPFLVEANQRGLGEIDLEKIEIHSISLS